MYLNRRDFLKITGLTTTINLLPAIGFGKKDEVLIGHNTHRYKVVKGWGMLDTQKNPVNDCHEMVEDAKGRLILLTNETKNNVLIYDKSGKLLSFWGKTYPGAHGLTLSTEGDKQYLFICDTELNQVIKTDLNGNEIFKLSYPKETGVYTSQTQYKPTESAVNPINGDIYIVDGYGLNYVIQYDKNGKYLKHWGGTGNGNEQFQCNHGIVVDTRNPQNPSLIVTSRKQNCLKRFTLDGIYISTIHLPGSFICRPVIKDKNIFGAVFRSTLESNANSGYIQIIDENDRVISSPGATEPIYVNNELKVQQKYDPSNIFLHPHDVCIDNDQNIYIPQWASNKTYPIKLERV